MIRPGRNGACGPGDGPPSFCSPHRRRESSWAPPSWLVPSMVPASEPPPLLTPHAGVRHFYGHGAVNSSLWAIPCEARFMGWKRGWAGKQQALRQLQGQVAIAVFSTALLFCGKACAASGEACGERGSAVWVDAIPRLERGPGTLGVLPPDSSGREGFSQLCVAGQGQVVGPWGVRQDRGPSPVGFRSVPRDRSAGRVFAVGGR